jgi:hypothetical protein
MKTRIATSLGIALVLVFGIVGVMVAFGPQEAQADHSQPHPPTAIKAEAAPNDPNTVAKWTIEFINGQVATDGSDPDMLAGGTGNDFVIIEFEDDVQFPESIDSRHITITATDPRPMTDPDYIGTLVANPLGQPTIEKVAEYKGQNPQLEKAINETQVTLNIPDMEPSEVHTGSQGILGGAKVTIVFGQTAGIRNPTESKPNEGHGVVVRDKNGVSRAFKPGNMTATATDHEGNDLMDKDNQAIEVSGVADSNGDGNADPWMLSGYKVQVATSNSPARVTSSGRAVIPRKITVSDQDGARGSTITVVGKGFRNSITATVWNDENGNGRRDPAENDLTTALITGSDDFTATVTITNPPFSSITATNGINAVDGRNRTIITGRTYNNPISGTTYEERIPQYILESSILVTPGTASIGDTVQVTARDFLKRGLISDATTNVSIGGVPVDIVSNDNVSETGDATFDITIPNGVASGTQNLVVSNGSNAANRGTYNPDDGINTHNIVNTGGARFNMVISGAQLTVTPSENLVPNQTVTLVGRGFSTGGSAGINVDSGNAKATISGDDTKLEAGTNRGSDNLNEGKEIEVDNAGNWSSSFVIPVTSTTTTPGEHELSITDTQGRSGSVVLSMAPRVLTMTPASGRVGTRVQVEGSGFPADNRSVGAETTATVTIRYSEVAEPRTVVTLTPDGSGNVRGWFTVPLGAGIPSTNAVRAVYEIPANDVIVTTSAVHQVPRAGITLDQESGPAGTIVTITGGGFKRYTSVTRIDFGTLDVRSGFGLSTDGVGGFEATILVPGANTGAQAVSVKVGETTASATFTVSADVIVATPSPAAAPMPPADALAALIANDNNLVRVWQFDASMQNEAPDFGWSLYDPRPLFADANTIEMVEGGKFYWINVQNEQTAVLGGTSRTLYAGWNPVTW